MGFLDNVFKAVKKASEIVSEVEAASEKIKADSHTAAPAARSVNSAYMNVTPAKPSVEVRETFFDDDNEVEFTFMLSGDFVQFKSHAMEIDTAFTYEPDLNSSEMLGKPDLNKPYIFTSMGDGAVYELVEKFKEKGTVNGLIQKFENSRLLFKCKTDYYGQVMVLYGMDRGTIWENCGIALGYNKAIVGTPLEEKLIKILDEAAETYTEKVVSK